MYCSTHSLDFFNLQKRRKKKKEKRNAIHLKVLYFLFFFFIRIIYIKSLLASSHVLCSWDKGFYGFSVPIL